MSRTLPLLAEIRSAKDRMRAVKLVAKRAMNDRTRIEYELKVVLTALSQIEEGAMSPRIARIVKRANQCLELIRR